MLNSPRRNDFGSDIFAEAQMLFDGSSVGHFRISDTLIDPYYTYKFDIDLNTGATVRVP